MNRPLSEPAAVEAREGVARRASEPVVPVGIDTDNVAQTIATFNGEDASSSTSSGHPLTYAERNAPFWRRNLAVSVFGSFTTLVSLTMLLPFLPLYVQQLGVASQAAVVQWSGVAFGATFLGTGLTAPIWGRLADRYGRKPMLIRAALGMAITMSLIGLARNVYELVALRLMAGFIGGYAAAALVLVGTQAPTARAGWALGLLSTGALTGNLVGPLIGGILPSLIGIRATFFAGGGLIGIAALLTIFLVREDFRKDLDARRSRATDSQSPSHNRIVVPVLLLTAMMVLVANFSIEPIITVYVAQLGVQHDHLAQTAGVIMACSAAGSIVTSAKLGRLADRIGGWFVIVGCLVGTAIVLIPQAFVTTWWQLAILRGVMGMTLAGLLPSIAKLIRQSVHETNTGKTLGYLSSAQFFGQVIGPLLGGVAGVHLGLRSVFIATAILLTGCALVVRWAQPQAQ